jgi:hypothetical protein
MRPPACSGAAITWPRVLGALELRDYVATHPHRIDQLNLPARAKVRNLDLAYRPWKNELALRLRVLQLVDHGTSDENIFVCCRTGTRLAFLSVTSEIRPTTKTWGAFPPRRMFIATLNGNVDHA